MTLKVDILSKSAEGIFFKVSANPPDSGGICGNPYNPIFLEFPYPQVTHTRAQPYMVTSEHDGHPRMFYLVTGMQTGRVRGTLFRSLFTCNKSLPGYTQYIRN